MLEAPCALADIQRNRVAAEFIHRNFHRSASAKRRVKEDKRDALSVKRALAIVASLDLLGQVDQRSQVIGREAGRAEKVSPFQIHKFRVWLIEDPKPLIIPGLFCSTHPGTNQSQASAASGEAAASKYSDRPTAPEF